MANFVIERWDSEFEARFIQDFINSCSVSCIELEKCKRLNITKKCQVLSDKSSLNDYAKITALLLQIEDMKVNK